MILNITPYDTFNTTLPDNTDNNNDDVNNQGQNGKLTLYEGKHVNLNLSETPWYINKIDDDKHDNEKNNELTDNTITDIFYLKKKYRHYGENIYMNIICFVVVILIVYATYKLTRSKTN